MLKHLELSYTPLFSFKPSWIFTFFFLLHPGIQQYGPWAPRPLLIDSVLSASSAVSLEAASDFKFSIYILSLKQSLGMVLGGNLG